ncbi:hypothetical protein BGZ63DRAFT_377683 [Mariannaea sp. PMI_226]|nr:hypothetical protein BGZ63DRAFT_377683 [Mariannaea sp. PMI_226]
MSDSYSYLRGYSSSLAPGPLSQRAQFAALMAEAKEPTSFKFNNRKVQGPSNFIELRPEYYMQGFMRVAVDDRDLPSKIVLKETPCNTSYNRGWAYESDVYDRLERFQVPCAARLLGKTKWGGNPTVILSDVTGKPLLRGEVPTDEAFVRPRITDVLRALRKAGVDTKLNPGNMHYTNDRFYILTYNRALLKDLDGGPIRWDRSFEDEVSEFIEKFQQSVTLHQNTKSDSEGSYHYYSFPD